MSQALDSPLPCSCSTGGEAQSVLGHFTFLLSLGFIIFYFFIIIFWGGFYYKNLSFAELSGPVGLSPLSVVTRSAQSWFQKSLFFGNGLWRKAGRGKGSLTFEQAMCSDPADIPGWVWDEHNALGWFKILCLVPFMKTCRIWLQVQEQTALPCFSTIIQINFWLSFKPTDNAKFFRIEGFLEKKPCSCRAWYSSYLHFVSPLRLVRVTINP